MGGSWQKEKKKLLFFFFFFSLLQVLPASGPTHHIHPVAVVVSQVFRVHKAGQTPAYTGELSRFNMLQSH